MKKIDDSLIALFSVCLIPLCIAVGIVIGSSGELASTIISIVFSTCLGALLAFYFQNRHEKHKKIEEEVRTINRLLFVLMERWNSLEMYTREIICGKESDPIRYLNIPPTIYSPLRSNEIPFNELSFMLHSGSKERSEFLHRLYHLDNTYELAKESIRVRSEIHLNVYQPIMAQESLNHGEEIMISPQNIKEVMGPINFHELEKSTSNAIDFTKRCSEMCSTLMVDVTKNSKEIYKNWKFTSYELIPEDPAE